MTEWNDVYIYVPNEQQIVRISEGTGDNLLAEDIDEGYVDYIYYEQFDRDIDFPEVDGGQVMLTEMFRDKFKSTKEAIPSVLDMAYGNEDESYILLD